jgi:hypothetical protein
MVVFAGDVAFADETNDALKTGTVIARGRRTTNSTAAATEQSVLRLDNVSVLLGRVYWIGTGPLGLDTTVASATGAMVNASFAESVDCGAFYVPSADEVLSILLTTSRSTGTGNISLAASATAPIDLYVVDMGTDPGDTGVDL